MVVCLCAHVGNFASEEEKSLKASEEENPVKTQHVWCSRKNPVKNPVFLVQWGQKSGKMQEVLHQKGEDPWQAIPPKFGGWRFHPPNLRSGWFWRFTPRQKRSGRQKKNKWFLKISPPEFGGWIFTPQIWGVWVVRDPVKTKEFWQQGQNVEKM